MSIIQYFFNFLGCHVMFSYMQNISKWIVLQIPNYPNHNRCP